MKIPTRRGPPTPDDLDELITKVWKEPAFFLAHPRAIAAFGRECTRRGVPPPTINLFGTPFLTWRGIPLVPSDKLKITDVANGTGKTTILLMRTGEKKQGVVGLFQPGVPGEVTPSLSVRFMGINRKAIASYLISLYCSSAILTRGRPRRARECRGGLTIMSTPDPRHAAASAPVADPASPQWGGQAPSVIDPGSDRALGECVF